MSVSVIEQVVTEQQNTLTTFVTLLVREEKSQAQVKEKEKDKDATSETKDEPKEKKSRDVIVTDTQCK